MVSKENCHEKHAHLVLGIPELLQYTPNRTLLVSGLLPSKRSDLWRGPAYEHFYLLSQTSRRDVLLDNILVNEPLRASPSRRGLVKEVNGLESIGVRLAKRVEFFAHENVGLRDVGEEQCEFGLVGGVCEGVADDLV